jgi:Mrp family chromosome partitioning ATPase
MERRKTGVVPYVDSRSADSRPVDSRTLDSRSVDSKTKPLTGDIIARTQPMTLAPIAPVQGLLDSIAASPSLRSLSEQLGASSAYNGPCRILMTGCRPGDGVSTVAAAMALDMSQRLAARTVLVEGQPRVALMHPFFSRAVTPAPASVSNASIAVQGTQWPRLETARPEQMALAEQPAQLVEDLDELMIRYRLAVIDLGVVRLDPRMLALARPNDPILIVARHLHTDRAEMIATANVLRNTGHPVAGVILNGYKSPLPRPIRRLFGMEA